jgi:Amiloride-sensitive sodium channel
MNYEETTEEFAYDTISFLCDIGGTLGLLLGASGVTQWLINTFHQSEWMIVAVLSMIQIADVFIRHLMALPWKWRGWRAADGARKLRRGAIVSISGSHIGHWRI